MTYHIARNNQQLGAFSKEDTLARYNRGEILPTDLVWTDGMTTWQSASQIFGAPVPAAAATPPPFLDATSASTPAPAPTVTPPAVPPFSAGAIAEPCPPNHLTLAIVATVLSVLTCSVISLVLGIIAIVTSTQVQTKYNVNDVAGAKSSAKTSQILAWISIGITILVFVVMMIVFMAIGLNNAALHQ
jgi:hypothetical protein